MPTGTFVRTVDGKQYPTPVPETVETSRRVRDRARLRIPGPETGEPDPSAVAATLAWLADRYPASTVAAAVGADKPAVIGWANGTTRPTGVQVARLATLAAVPVDVFYRHPEP